MKKTRTKTNCFACNAEIEVMQCHMKKYKHHYCNRKCAEKGRSELYKGDGNPVKKHKMCGLRNYSTGIRYIIKTKDIEEYRVIVPIEGKSKTMGTYKTLDEAIKKLDEIKTWHNNLKIEKPHIMVYRNL